MVSPHIIAQIYYFSTISFRYCHSKRVAIRCYIRHISKCQRYILYRCICLSYDLYIRETIIILVSSRLTRTAQIGHHSRILNYYSCRIGSSSRFSGTTRNAVLEWTIIRIIWSRESKKHFLTICCYYCSTINSRVFYYTYSVIIRARYKIVGNHIYLHRCYITTTTHYIRICTTGVGRIIFGDNHHTRCTGTTVICSVTRSFISTTTATTVVSTVSTGRSLS